jgi:hypothetical protein
MRNNILLIGAAVALSATISTAHAGGVDPYALYTFEDGTAADSSGNGLDGTVLSGITFGAAGSGRDGVGRSITSASVAGLSGIEVPISGNTSVFPEITFGAWVKFDGTGDIGKFISADNGSFDWTVGIDFRGDDSGVNYAAFTGDGVIDAPGSISAGIWQMVAVVYSTTATELYVDGALAASGSVSASITGFDFHIGGNPGFTEDWNGMIDDVFFFDTAVSAGEIAHLYNDINYSTPTPTVPLPAGLPLLLAGLGGLAFLRRKPS